MRSQASRQLGLEIFLEYPLAPVLVSIPCPPRGTLQSENPAHPGWVAAAGAHRGESQPRTLPWLLCLELGPSCPRGAAASVRLKEQDEKRGFLQPGGVHECALQRRRNEDNDQDQG